VSNGPGPFILPLPWHSELVQVLMIKGLTLAEKDLATESQLSGVSPGSSDDFVQDTMTTIMEKISQFNLFMPFLYLNEFSWLFEILITKNIS
jgi:hypothetical protein